MLSIDGGGVRGIIPALVLDHLERSTGSPCAELFDLMVGTSTGGIIALALSLADEGGGSRYSANDLVTLYSERSDDITVVSLGTGELIRPIPGNTAAGWGSAGWILPLLDCMFDGASKAVNHQMSQFLGARYQRFQLSLESASDDMDDASEENLAALKNAGERLISQESQRLDELVAYFRAVQSQRRPSAAALDNLVF